jgi:hypothetical protein
MRERPETQGQTHPGSGLSVAPGGKWQAPAGCGETVGEPSRSTGGRPGPVHGSAPAGAKARPVSGRNASVRRRRSDLGDAHLPDRARACAPQAR